MGHRETTMQHAGQLTEPSGERMVLQGTQQYPTAQFC